MTDDGVRLTNAQRTALRFLASRPNASPAELGYALTEGRKYPMVPQGAGRLGGTMAWRLIKVGLAESAALLRGGFPAYAITPAGRTALSRTEAPERSGDGE